MTWKKSELSAYLIANYNNVQTLQPASVDHIKQAKNGGIMAAHSAWKCIPIVIGLYTESASDEIVADAIRTDAGEESAIIWDRYVIVNAGSNQPTAFYF